MVFIPNFSTLNGEPQDPEENAKEYAESQQQRALERKLREEKRDLEVMKAQGASEDQLKAQRERVRSASADIDQFCDETGRARKRNREYAPVNAEFPDVPKTTQAQIVQSTPQPIASQFVPAETIEGAEEYAKQFLQSEKYGNVSYKGIDIEYANKANKALTEVFNEYTPQYKLGAIEPMNPRKSIFKDAIESAEASYKWGGDGALYVNPRFYKTTKTFAEHKAQIDELMDTVLNNGNILLEQAQGRKKEYIEALLGTGRQCVSQSYDFVEASFVHECGHMLDDKMFRKVMKDTGSPLGVVGGLSESMVKYGKGISGYSVSTVQEYIAESFTAWWYGETSIVDPELIKVFEEAKKIGK